MVRAQIKPEMFTWARERAGLSAHDLAGKLPWLDSWECGDTSPTLKQVKSFSKATHALVGYLFFQLQPIESIPIPDFRTVGSRRLTRPTPHLRVSQTCFIGS
jgi:hypothetical protein